jgi:hypothetical protein
MISPRMRTRPTASWPMYVPVSSTDEPTRLYCMQALLRDRTTRTRLRLLHRPSQRPTLVPFRPHLRYLHPELLDVRRLEPGPRTGYGPSCRVNQVEVWCELCRDRLEGLSSSETARVVLLQPTALTEASNKLKGGSSGAVPLRPVCSRNRNNRCVAAGSRLPSSQSVLGVLSNQVRRRPRSGDVVARKNGYWGCRRSCTSISPTRN